jgi:hypothetical protein
MAEPGAKGSSVMLHSLSKQVAQCYVRAAECRELARSREAEREFYLGREEAWLRLARSCQFSERICRMLTEMQRKKLRNWPLLNPALLALSLPTCPNCKAETRLQSSALFVCINCQRIVEDQLVFSDQVSIVPGCDS